MEKRIAFMSTGCQSAFGRPREIIASFPELKEVKHHENPDYVMVNFCAISTENLDAYGGLKRQLLQMKQTNPKLKILAGGCVEGLSIKKDLSFADAIYHHQEEATAFLHFLGYDSIPNPKPAIIYGVAYIVIAQGCNRRCTFCKVHYLDHMQLTSRPISEIITLIYVALDQGIHNIHLVAENSTEYGCDIGTNFCELLEAIFAIKDIRYVDISGSCADEVSPRLLKLLQNPKVRQIQLEAQSFNDSIRRAMGLNKTSEEILAMFDALRDKAVTSIFMSGFINSNVKEFDREMGVIRRHSLHFLSLSPYDDTEGTPSHQRYQKPSKDELFYYQYTFINTVAAERQLLLEQLIAKDSIEASVIIIDKNRYTLQATNYAIKVYARNFDNRYRIGDVVRVKITRLHQIVPENKQREFLANAALPRGSSGNIDHEIFLRNMQYFGGPDRIMIVKGTIIE